MIMFKCRDIWLIFVIGLFWTWNRCEGRSLRRCKSRELRASIWHSGYDCLRRNGLQDDCYQRNVNNGSYCSTNALQNKLMSMQCERRPRKWQRGAGETGRLTCDQGCSDGGASGGNGGSSAVGCGGGGVFDRSDSFECDATMLPYNTSYFPSGPYGPRVNISNTWTLPQDGFAVFYRFFRDKISWFEADAVCQFHHANLVTVDNGQQFDAAREFLKVLGVTDSVWIGLMRPQNSERFAWSNSKTLTSSAGYWAESLPVIEAPLCAVIDPIRDFRWHALRCGGPETASFLCEMNVPNWAVDCTIQGIPDLTIQYMADSGSVELTKDCGDDEILHHVCKGKQDRARIMKELVCKNERKETAEDNSITSTDLADTHHKSLQIISNIPSDNNEDNNIHFQEQLQEEKKEPEQNPVQKLIEQFNVEELMQADQPQMQEMIPKPVKKIPPKKVQINEKKDRFQKKQKSQKEKPKTTFSEEVMMGDQPRADINQIQEPLPHIKKSLPQDLKHQTTSQSPTVSSTTTELHATEPIEITTQGVPEETSSVFIAVTSPENSEIGSSSPVNTAVMTDLTTERAAEHATSIETAQQTQTTDEPVHTPHPKDHGDNHFIPPMLLVKSHYTSSKPHPEDQSPTNFNPKSENMTPNHDITSQTTFDTTINSTTLTTSMAENFKVANTTFEPSRIGSTHQQHNHQIVDIKIGSSSSETPAIQFSITTRPDLATASAIASHDTTTSATTTDIDETYSHPSSSASLQGVVITNNEFPSGNSNLETTSEQSDIKQLKSKKKNKFSNEENFQPYRPNRRRSLTKPEATNYLKKMLG